MKCRNCCLVSWFIIGIVVALLGVILATILLPIIVKNIMAKELVISEKGATWKGWTKPSYKVGKQVYVFNVTNAKDVIRKGAVPSLKEVGPFGYRITVWKDNLSFSDDGSSLEFITWRQFHFDPDLSCKNCTEDTILTVPNLLLFTIMKNLNGASYYVKSMLAGMFQRLRAEPFITKRAGDLLFDGYDENILRFAQEPLLKGFLPEGIPKGKLSLFYGLNNSNDGLYKINTGLHDINNVGKIKTWNGETVLPESWWWSEGARMLNGTPGGRFKPHLERSDQLQFFISHIFRSLNLDFDNEFTFGSNLRAFRFIVSNESFTWSLPWNKGFCNPKSAKFFPNQSASCFPDGIMDISSCKEGNPPTAISWPHFLYSEPQVTELYQDLQPDVHRHQSMIDLEPVCVCDSLSAQNALVQSIEVLFLMSSVFHTGALLTMKLRLQVNLGITGDDQFLMLKHIPRMMVPLFWIDQGAEIDPPTRDMLIGQLSLIDKGYMACYSVGAVGAIISLVVCIIGGMILCISCKKPKKVRVIPIT